VSRKIVGREYPFGKCRSPPSPSWCQPFKLPFLASIFHSSILSSIVPSNLFFIVPFSALIYPNTLSLEIQKSRGTRAFSTTTLTGEGVIALVVRIEHT
jgi:hypothetical protein